MVLNSESLLDKWDDFETYHLPTAQRNFAVKHGNTRSIRITECGQLFVNLISIHGLHHRFMSQSICVKFTIGDSKQQAFVNYNKNGSAFHAMFSFDVSNIFKHNLHIQTIQTKPFDKDVLLDEQQVKVDNLQGKDITTKSLTLKCGGTLRMELKLHTYEPFRYPR